MPMQEPSAGQVPRSPSDKNAPATMLVIGLVAGLAGGYFIGNLSGGGSLLPDTGGSFQEGYDAAHTKLIESGLLGTAQTEVLALAGTVVSTEEGVLTLTVDYTSPDPLDTRTIPTTRRVRITNETVIVVATEKDQAEYEAELEAYFAENPEEPGDEPPPTPFSEEVIPLSSLSDGDRVTVEAESDILLSEEFTATRIEKSIDAAPDESPGPGRI